MEKSTVEAGIKKERSESRKGKIRRISLRCLWFVAGVAVVSFFAVLKVMAAGNAHVLEHKGMPEQRAEANLESVTEATKVDESTG